LALADMPRELGDQRQRPLSGFFANPSAQVQLPSALQWPCSELMLGSSLHVWSLPGVHTEWSCRASSAASRASGAFASPHALTSMYREAAKFFSCMTPATERPADLIPQRDRELQAAQEHEFAILMR
jgi:hypothetical protein